MNESMNGKYWSTCSKDITSSQGWLKKMLLLGLIYFVPVFGQMTLFGYAYEWAHKAAWGVDAPLPEKIYGRRNSKMLRWGWFALVIAVVFALIPSVVINIGQSIAGASAGTGVISAHSDYYGMAAGSIAGVGFGGLIQLIGFAASLLAGVLTWVAVMRMMMYDRLGAGFQLGQIWKMAKHDFGGLLRIFGMSLATGAVIAIAFSLIVFVLAFVVVAIAAVMGVGVFADTYYGGGSMGYGGAIGAAVMVIMLALPVFLIVFYALFVALAWQTVLVARAAGYWTAQFDVAHWGKKEDPLPFERAEQQAQGATFTTPQQPAQAAPQAAPEQQSVSQQPAQPEAAQPAQPDSSPAVETVAEDAPADVEVEQGEPAAATAPADGSEATQGAASAEDSEANGGASPSSAS